MAADQIINYLNVWSVSVIGAVVSLSIESSRKWVVAKVVATAKFIPNYYKENKEFRKASLETRDMIKVKVLPEVTKMRKDISLYTAREQRDFQNQDTLSFRCNDTWENLAETYLYRSTVGAKGHQLSLHDWQMIIGEKQLDDYVKKLEHQRGDIEDIRNGYIPPDLEYRSLILHHVITGLPAVKVNVMLTPTQYHNGRSYIEYTGTMTIVEDYRKQ